MLNANKKSYIDDTQQKRCLIALIGQERARIRIGGVVASSEGQISPLINNSCYAQILHTKSPS